MIENTFKRNQRDRQLARRRGVAPSQHLRRHFVSLARQVCQWADLQNLDSQCVTIGVTSLKKGAGNSTICFNLASALTSIGRQRALLVESDFANPYLSRRLGFAKLPGFGEVLVGDAEFDDVVHPTPLTDLSMIGCGQTTEIDSPELPFDLIPGLVAEHAGEFGYMVFDLPLAESLTACHSITKQLDGIILNVESNQLEQRAIRRFQNQLECQGTKIIGVVINKA